MEVYKCVSIKRMFFERALRIDCPQAFKRIDAEFGRGEADYGPAGAMGGVDGFHFGGAVAVVGYPFGGIWREGVSVGDARKGVGEVFVDEVDDGEDGDEENREHRYCSCE